ncbi:MAG: hypothetical protein EOP46_20695, partial [Sphingobacteriaceae bacterium]
DIHIGKVLANFPLTNINEWPPKEICEIIDSLNSEILNRNFHSHLNITIFYITRTYLTRHGEGPFNEETLGSLLHNLQMETNEDNTYQGRFKRGCLNIDLMNYALNCDGNYSSQYDKVLVITCADQLTKDFIPILFNKEQIEIKLQSLLSYLKQKFIGVIISKSNCAENLPPYF